MSFGVALGLFVVSVPAASPVLVDRIVASVDNHVVTRFMIDQRVKLGASASRADLRDALIDELIVQNECDRLNISIDSDVVERALHEVASANQITQEQLVAAVEARGMSLTSYRDELRKQLLTMRWVMQQGDQSVDHATPEARSTWLEGQRRQLLDEARKRQIVDVREGEP